MRIKQTGEIGRINAADGGVVYVRLDGTNESKVFSAFADEQAAIEVVIPEPRAFAAGMKRDQSAILAALTFAWSQGQVERQINRLKLIKRQAYGRAGFDLLRHRVLAHSA